VVLCSILFYPTAVYAWCIYMSNKPTEKDVAEVGFANIERTAEERLATESTPLLID
jgi:hypothetical protein